MILRLPLVAVLLTSGLLAQIEVYHGVSPQQHQAQVDALRPQGYRMLSLSVAGGLLGQNYTAVWRPQRRADAPFEHIHGATRSAYVSWRALWQSRGYRLQLISASGSGAFEVFTAVAVQDGVQTHELFDVDIATFVAQCTWARDNGFRLTCAAEFGTALIPRFCAVFEANPGKVAWGYGLNETSSRLQQRFDAMTEAHGRPTLIARNEHGRYLSIWSDDRLGPFSVRWGMTALQFLVEQSQQEQQGRYPLFAEASGSGANARWVAMFAERDIPLSRTLTKVPASVPSTALDPFDDYLTQILTTSGARAGSIAIAKDGRLVFARAYTNAESDYPIAQPTSLFRIGSCTKVLVAIAAHELAELGGASMSTLVGPFLGLTGHDPNFDTITVADTIQHVSGIRGNTDAWAVAQWLNPIVPTLPVTSWNTTRYHAAHPLSQTPRTVSEYSNEGYTVLGSVIERSSGKPFEQFLRENVAAPLGVTRIWIGGNRRDTRKTGEVLYHHNQMIAGPSHLHTDRRLLAEQYGGRFDLNRTHAPGGFVTSTIDSVRLLSGAFACEGPLLRQSTVDGALAQPVAPREVDRAGFAWQLRGNGVIAHGKNGSIAGGQTQFVWRSDGVAIAAVTNRSDAGISREELNQLADAVSAANAWPTGDLFPSYGLSSFPRVCPRFTNVTPAELPNVTDGQFVLTGEGFDNVTHATFGGQRLDPHGTRAWRHGWIRVVSDSVLEVHPPQGQPAGTYEIRAFTATRHSEPISVQLTLPTSPFLLAPAWSTEPYRAFLARGDAGLGTVALMTFSLSDAPSVFPGIVELGIGNNFRALGLWPVSVPFDPACHCARWDVPAIRQKLHLQAVIVSLRAPMLPLTTSNVHTVSPGRSLR